MGTVSEIGLRELDHRSNDGIDVTLLWNRSRQQVVVVVGDERTGDSFEFTVAAADALDAFRHPFAYADRDCDLALAG